MDAQDRAIQKLAKELAGIKREVVSWRGPQADYTSIENSGNFTFKDSDGNVTAVVGGQDDGSNTIRHVDGPVPPIPSGLSAHVDGPIIQVSWDGTFESDVTHDWHYLEVLAVGPNDEQLTGTIDNADGGSTSLAATLQGDWVIVARSVSRAGKRSLDGDAGTVAVQLVGLTGAIEAVQSSADGKNTIYYSTTMPPGTDYVEGDLWFDTSEDGNNRASVWDGAEWLSVADGRVTDIAAAQDVLDANQEALDGRLDDAFGQIEDAIVSANGKNVVHYEADAPTAADPGVEGDTWFVGEFGRPNDVVEATNIVANSSLETDAAGWSPYWWTGSGSRTQGAGAFGDWFYRLTATSAITGTKGRYHDVLTTVKSGQKWTLSIHVRPSRTMSLRPRGEFRGPSGAVGSAQYGNYFTCPAGEWTRIHLTITAVGDATTIRHQTYLHDATLQAGDTLDLDAEMIALGQLAPYFDGDTESGATDDDPHYRWSGTPHASTSEKYLPALDIGESDNWNVTEQHQHDGTVWKRVELSHEVISTMDVGKLVAGSAAIKEAVVQKLWAEVVVAKMVVASEFIGENAILTGAVTADKMAVGSITAESGIIESLDLGKATVGELDGIRIMGQTVRGQQLSGDAIDGKVITGPTIQSARTGQRWVGDATGIRIFNADNEVRTQLSPDGSTFKGEVEADTLVVNGGSELRSTENKLAQGAKLTLEAGVTDPTAPPTVQPYWDATEFTPGTINGEPMKPVGLAWDGTSYWTAPTAHSRAGVSGASNRILGFRIDATGSGSFVNITIPHGTPYHSEVFGVTCIGSELFWLGRSTYEGMVWVTDLAGEFKRAFAYPDLGYSSSNPLGYKPGIGHDGTNVVVAQCDDAGPLNVRTYNKTTGARIATVSDAGNDASDMSGVYIGSGDWGVTRIVIAKTKTRALVAKTTAGVYDEPRSWGSANNSDSTGVVFVDGKFRTLDPTGKIHEYADTNTGDKSGDWWATYRWSADVDEDGINDSVSRIGPVKQFTWPHRARLKFLGAPLPDGVGYITPSIAKKATKPSRTDFRTPVFVVHEGTSTAMLDTLPTDWLTGASPSDVNSFPNAEPSTLVSSSNTFEVNGDGSGRWGPLTFNADGTMSSSAVPDWVPITSFATGFSAQTWGFAPAYRVWPDGKVEWRGVVAGTINKTSHPFVIPAMARPAQPVNMAAAVQSAGTEYVTRVEFCPDGNPTQFRVYRGSADRTWVSLDGLTYYKS